MPCLLKRPGRDSPGIVTFTQNEALWGVPGAWPKSRAFVERASAERKWLFGIHVQGDMSQLPRWPVQPWHGFIMWPEPGARFLTGFAPHQIVPMNCINFMPDVPPPAMATPRTIDICVISRAAKIKRIVETLQILRGLFDVHPGLTATLIVPDHRHYSEGERSYEVRGIDRRFFELPLQLFSARQLKNLSFLSSSEESFGRFPLSNDLMIDLLRRSKLMLLTSHNEGTPRVIAEALQCGTPCVLSKSLHTGIRAQLDERNSLFIDDDIPTAVRQIHDALTHPERFAVDLQAVRQAFSASEHVARLREQLSALIVKGGAAVDGEWFLDDLHLRLAGHLQKHNAQFMNNERLFFDWLDKVQRVDPYDEDAVLGSAPLNDESPFSPVRAAKKAARRIAQRLYQRLVVKP